MDPRRKDGTFPFEYTNSASTDIRKTFAKHAAAQVLSDKDEQHMASPASAAPKSILLRRAK